MLNRFFAISMMLLGALAVSPAQLAFAQEGSADELEEIVVKGQRLANKRAIDMKRNNDNVMDGVSQDDIGKLPDHNVADALGRISGVFSVLDEGEGRYVSIRGLSPEFVNVSKDGASLSAAAAPWDGQMRASNMEAVPSDIVGRVEVIKSVTPDMDGNAIGGSVRLVTRSAFDSADMLFRTDIALGQYERDETPDHSNDPSLRGSLTFSSVFGAEEQFGVVANVSHRKRDSDQLKTIRTGWHTLGQNVTPGDYWNYIYSDTTDRTSYNLKLEFRPSDTFESFISASTFYEDHDENKLGHYLFARGELVDPDGDLVGDIVDAGGSRVRGFNTKYGTDEALTLQAGADWFVGDSDAIEVRVSNSQSTFYHDNDFTQWDSITAGYDGTFDNTGFVARYELDAPSSALFEDPDNYQYSFGRRSSEDRVKEITEAKIDWSHDMDAEGWGFKTGAKLYGMNYDKRYTQIEVDNHATSPTLSQLISVTDYVAPGMTNRFLMADAGGVFDYYNANPSEFDLEDIRNNRNNYDVEEDVTAAYLMGQHTGLNHRIVGGVRYERTDWTASSRLNAQEDAEIITRDGDYADVLPSVVYSYDFTDQLRLRLAYGKTLGRPDAGDLAASETLPEDDNNGSYRRSNPDLKPRRSTNLDAAIEYYFDDGNSIVALGLFNKDIKDEIFVLRETYTYTYEDPANDIEDGVMDGVYNEAQVTQPMNAGTAQAQGFELSFVKGAFDFLPAPWSNLGGQITWTHTEGEFEIVNADGDVIRKTGWMTHQPEDVVNAALFYEGEKLSWRLAYQDTAKYYNSFDSSAATLPNGDEYYEDDRWDAIDRWDLRINYDWNENFRIFFEGANLTSEPRVRRYGEARLRESVDNGSSMWLGISYML